MRQTEKARELLVGQPTVDTRDSLGTTPLMQCAEMGELQLMQWLIDHLADVNARDRFGQTPLMYAAGSNQLTAARLLLRYGANPALQAKTGQTAFDIAVVREGDTVADMLREEPGVIARK